MNVRFGHHHQCSDALSLYEVIHDVRSHVRSIDIELKECVIVPGRHCPLHLQGVLDRWVRLLFGG